MQIKKEPLPKAQMTLTLDLAFDEFQPFIQKATRRLSQKVTLPGFRPGQVPYDVLKLHIPEMEVYQEAANLAVNKTLLLALTQEKINAVGKPEVSIEKLAPNNPFVYKVILSLLPEVELPDLQKMPKVEKRKVEVAPDDIKNALLNIQKKHHIETRTQDKAQTNDKVEVDFEIFKNNVLVENGSYKKFTVIIGEETLIPGFEAELISLREGDTKKFDLKFPEKHYHKTLAGVKATFSVKVLSVSHRSLPALDDSFVQKISMFKTLDELKNTLKRYLLSEQEKREQDRFEQTMLETIKKHTTFTEIPDCLISEEQTRIFHAMKTQMEERGLRFNDYLEHVKKTEEAIKQEYRSQAVEQVKYALLLHEIAQREDIQISEQDIEKERDRVLQALHDDDDTKEYFTSTNSNPQLALTLKHRKVIEFLQTRLSTPTK